MKAYKSTTRNTDDLIPYINNARTHDETQVNQVAASIKEFGFTNPVLIDEQNGVIAGHGRIMAAKKLGLKEVPCIVLDGLTAAQKKAYVIADNKLALNSDWDFNLLQVEIEALQESGYPLELLGFNESEIEEIIDGWTSDIEIPEYDDAEDDSFTIKIKGSKLDHADVMNLVERAIEESGIEGLTVA